MTLRSRQERKDGSLILLVCVCVCVCVPYAFFLIDTNITVAGLARRPGPVSESSCHEPHRGACLASPSSLNNRTPPTSCPINVLRLHYHFD